MSQKSQRPWKKNFIRIPESIVRKLRTLDKDIVVACTRKVPVDTVRAGVFNHIGIKWVDDAARYPDNPVVPSPKNGRYSTRNVDGREMKRKDLPMVSHTVTFDTPNYGDWSRGSHEVSWSRDVYQKEYEAPRNLDLSVELLNTETSDAGPVFVFRFQVNAVLRKGTSGFNDELLYALNLLQENVGAADVFAADASREDYLKTVYVAWEILPPGERDATIAKVLSRIKQPSEEMKARILERYNLLSGMKPTAFIAGTSGFQRYFGAQFADDLVVFENLEYGNAAYVMFEDWPTLSQQSRLELLRGDTSKFVRVVHSKGWKTQLKAVVEEKRPKRMRAGAGEQREVVAGRL
jgi:hypothetical protein